MDSYPRFILKNRGQTGSTGWWQERRDGAGERHGDDGPPAGEPLGDPGGLRQSMARAESTPESLPAQAMEAGTLATAREAVTAALVEVMEDTLRCLM